MHFHVLLDYGSQNKTSGISKNVDFVLALNKAHVLALNTAHVLRLNKADVLALNKAQAFGRLQKGGRPSAAHPFVVFFVSAVNTGHMLVLRQKRCAFVESQDIW